MFRENLALTGWQTLGSTHVELTMSRSPSPERGSSGTPVFHKKDSCSVPVDKDDSFLSDMAQRAEVGVLFFRLMQVIWAVKRREIRTGSSTMEKFQYDYEPYLANLLTCIREASTRQLYIGGSELDACRTHINQQLQLWSYKAAQWTYCSVENGTCETLCSMFPLLRDNLNKLNEMVDDAASRRFDMERVRTLYQESQLDEDEACARMYRQMSLNTPASPLPSPIIAYTGRAD